ncbi:hypothetical protein V8J88_21030 [Massilia sp. W12]|uniref:hypothetical protein n=1 Tax=Massilia sp. W12 TaxID=3126507 RepID=UPI0030CAE2F6
MTNEVNPNQKPANNTMQEVGKVSPMDTTSQAQATKAQTIDSPVKTNGEAGLVSADKTETPSTATTPQKLAETEAVDKAIEKQPTEAASSATQRTAPTEAPPTTIQDASIANIEAENCSTGTLDLYIRDYHNDPVPNLQIKILMQGKIIYTGSVDSNGRRKIEKIPMHFPFEIRVKKDKAVAGSAPEDSDGYRFAAIGKLMQVQATACLTSPKTRFEFFTEMHAGPAGKAEEHKKAVIQAHNQKPDAQPDISRNSDKKPEIKADRNSHGQPKGKIIDGLQDWFGRNRNTTGNPHAGLKDIEKVKQLIEFADTQSGWEYSTGIISETYIQQMIKGSFKTPAAKDKSKSARQCNKYVKIALWRAGYGMETEPIGKDAKYAPARTMGPALISAGFTDVTKQLLDGRWAAPGDIIVYERIGAPNESGHIDIRTYDGYLSDFFQTYLPVKRFKVTGIYRKYHDPLPEKRMRAFLKVIASREAETLFKASGYESTFYALPILKGHKGPPPKFESFATHPFKENPTTRTPSGAYGITLKTWKNYLTFLDLDENQEKFTPSVQDRIAITIMEQVQNALALVRIGKIEQAANILAMKQQWSCLPGGAETRGFGVKEMMQSYEQFFGEMK